MKKKILSVALSLAMVLALVACSSSSDTAETTTAAAEEDTSASEAESVADDGADSSGSTSGSISTKITLITQDQIDTHWVRLDAAAEARVEELNAEGNNIEITWMAPETKDNAGQIQRIEAAISDGTNYLIIATNDATASNNALQEALDAGITLIYVDSPATIEASATFATDNYQGGVLAGEYLLNVLTEQGISTGTIGIVDAQAGVQACQDRYDGFASVFEGSDFTLGERQYSDGDSAKAQELANTLIANGVVALYGTNEGSTSGAAAATMDAMNNGTTIYTVGWDNSDTNIARVEDGSLQAFMAQNPDVMGTDAVDAVVALENGEDLGGEVVDTGVSVVDASNVDDFKL